MRRVFVNGFRLITLAALSCLGMLAQTTQGVISGRVLSVSNRHPVAAAHVSCFLLATNTRMTVGTDSAGYYILPFLTPGNYRLVIAAAGFRPIQRYEVEVPVAGRLELNFSMDATIMPHAA